jgi:alpha-L-rhamnosidase
LTYANTTSGSLYGAMVSNGSRFGEAGTFHIEVPVNATAKVYIPATNVNDVLEGGQPAAQADGATYLGNDGACVVFAVDSGVYRFASEMNEGR